MLELRKKLPILGEILVQRPAKLCMVLAILCCSTDLAADQGDEAVQYGVRPIGHVEKKEGKTRIVLKKQYEPGLLGLTKSSDFHVIWWFHKNDTH